MYLIVKFIIKKKSGKKIAIEVCSLFFWHLNKIIEIDVSYFKEIINHFFNKTILSEISVLLHTVYIFHNF